MYMGTSLTHGSKEFISNSKARRRVRAVSEVIFMVSSLLLDFPHKNNNASFSLFGMIMRGLYEFIVKFLRLFLNLIINLLNEHDCFRN